MSSKSPNKEELLNFLNELDPVPNELIRELNRNFQSSIARWMDRTKEDWKEFYGLRGADIYNYLHPAPQLVYAGIASQIEFSSALSAFWNALKDCQTPIEENQVIQLPLNVFILGNSTLGASIFIRHCYPQFLHMVLGIINAPDTKTPHLIVLGNPGIGKTYFGYVLLLHLARSGATVVYERGKEDCLYLFTPTESREGTREQFRPYLRDRRTYYIADACTPVDVAAKTILLSSPRRNVWYQFSKSHCTIRYMPIWSLEEIQRCREQIYNQQSEAETKSLFDRWGGIPRFVLEYANDVSQQELLDDAIKGVNLDSLIEAVGNPEALDEATHRLIHLHVAEDFLTKSYRLASDYVADEVYMRL